MSTQSISMERHRFGPTQRDVPVIGQGTWYIESGDRAAAIAALRLGLDLGMTHVDAAEMYGSGAAEEIVGEAIAERRDAIFLVSKVLPEHASRSGTIAACEDSLARLGTDRLDCYLLHWRGAYPLEETFAGFDQLERAGKILARGVSNFDVPDLEDTRDVAGERRITCNHVLYHLEERAIEHAALVRAARRRRGGIRALRPRPLSRPAHPRRPRAPGDRRRAQGDAAPGGAAFPGAAGVAPLPPPRLHPPASPAENPRPPAA